MECIILIAMDVYSIRIDYLDIKLGFSNYFQYYNLAIRKD